MPCRSKCKVISHKDLQYYSDIQIGAYQHLQVNKHFNTTDNVVDEFHLSYCHNLFSFISTTYQILSFHISTTYP